MRDELLELAGSVEEAGRWLETAEGLATDCCTNQQTGEPLPWDGMNEVLARIVKAQKEIAAILEPIKDDIKQAHEHQDEMEDRWDAQRL